MTIKENKVILYSDLINNAVDKIVSLCHNVDRTISDYFKLNNSETILNNGKVTITNILKTQPDVVSTYTSSGSITFPPNLSRLIVTLVGAGGSGGIGHRDGNRVRGHHYYYSGSGASGSFCKKTYTQDELKNLSGKTVSFTVGFGKQSSSGGDSSFLNLVAKGGGVGGDYDKGYTAGIATTGLNGDINEFGKPGQNGVYNTRYKTTINGGSGFTINGITYGSGGAGSYKDSIAGANGVAIIQHNMNNMVLPSSISRSVVESELRDFLAKRGILQNDDEVVSAKTLLNFSGNFSSFVAIHVRTFTRRLSNLTCYLSSTDTTSYPISLGRNQLGSAPVTQENSVTNLNEIMRNVNVQNRIENLSLTFTFACSSSSSSCSSSSSSSSSSSCCTSMFIAYMKI